MRRSPLSRPLIFLSVMILCSMILSPSARAEPIKHQITGLFMKEREADLRAALEKVPDVRLVNVDYASAEATFDYDPAKLFPGAKPEQRLQRFDNLLRTASNHTFGVKPLRTTPLDKLQRIEIPVAGCHCKACSLAAYEAIYRIEGVERAMASFREGLVTALIDPTRTDRAKLVEALKKRRVDVKAERQP